MARLLLLNGPNLNLLGDRETRYYGTGHLDEVNANLIEMAATLGHELICKQSNSESMLIQWIQDAKTDHIACMIINPAAYTHTSIAMRDAISAIHLPFIEVHISNIYARESFRHHSFFSDIAIGCISGLGIRGYEFALSAAHHYLKEQTH